MKTRRKAALVNGMEGSESLKSGRMRPYFCLVLWRAGFSKTEIVLNNLLLFGPVRAVAMGVRSFDSCPLICFGRLLAACM